MKTLQLLKNGSRWAILLMLCSNSFAQTNCHQLPVITEKVVEHILEETPSLTINPQFSATIFIDVDGYYNSSNVWNNGVPFLCAPVALTSAEITQSIYRSAEDLSPFEIKITTDSTVYFDAPLNRRVRIVVTPTSYWRPGASGISYTGQFTYGTDLPCFVFSDRLGNNIRMIGEIISHEAGHTIGLSHDATYDSSCTLTESYKMGNGTGSTSWGTIMGNSLYYENTTLNLATPFCGITQDEIAVIVSQNGFGFRSRTTGQVTTGGNVQLIIQQFRTDSIIINGTGTYLIQAESMGNTDVKLRINGQEANPVNSLSASITTAISGTTILEVLPAHNPNAPDGYGSTGQVNLTVTRLTTTPVVLPDPRPVARQPFFKYDQQNIYIRASKYSAYALYNSIGQLIRKGSYRPGNTIIPISNLFAGLYYLKSEFSTNKIIKL